VRKLIFALALGVILVPNHGYTLGLGEIEVNSSLNQKLMARIDLLSASPEDAESVIVKLASREEFVRAGLDRPLMLNTLKFKTSVEEGHVYIDVLSPKPIREPFLNFLVEVDWPKGHLIREYTILLDPPVFMHKTQKTDSGSSRPVMQEAASAAPVSVESSAPVLESVESDMPASVEKDAPIIEEVVSAEPVQQASYVAPDTVGHRIQEGDTAWSLANSMKSDDSVSTEQMLVAMLRANPEVFINENVNGLKRGYILRTPDYADIEAISHEEAKATVLQQNALWREYQQSLSSDQPASAIDESYTESEYSSAVDMNDDSRLSIVSAGGSSALGEMKDASEMTEAELRDQLALARESVETERVEKEALQGQVDSLSTQVDKMKGLLTIEDDAMAEMQSAATPSDDEALTVDDVGEEVIVDETVAELGDEEQALDALDALTGESAIEENLPAEGEELFVDETDATDQEVEFVADEEMVNEVEPAFVQPKEPGLIDILLNNRLIIAGLAAALLIIGAIGYLIKRRRDNASSDSEDALISEPFASSEEDVLEDVADSIDDESLDDLVSDEEVEASMEEAEAEEDFDAEATMILPSGTDTVVAPAAELQPEEEEEQDDVTAEADVYMAYGIYQQAEELLENAIKENPEKDVYRVKLAETYFAGKNSEALAKLGAEMKERLGDEVTPAWTKVVTMGKELCPDAEIFQQADAGASLDLDDMMPKSPEPMDIDLGDDAGDSTPDLDLDFDSPLDDGGLELPSMDETAVISPDETAVMSTEPESLDELEFDLGETEAFEEPAAEESADEEEFSLDIEASELDLDAGAPAEESSEEVADLDMDFDMSMDSEPEAIAEESSDDDSSMDFDLDMSMDDSATDDEVAAEIDLTEEAAVDDLDADLDLSMDDISSTEEPSEEVADLDMSTDDAGLDMSLDEDLSDVDLSEPVDVDEINTKLDLAKAYLDMGDHEGARDILDEVLAGGNADQKKEATELMAQAG